MKHDYDQRYGGSWNAHKNWKKIREKHRKHKASGNTGPCPPTLYEPKSSAGKGDMDRTSNQSKFALGMDLIKIAEKHGKESEEYKAALEAWRNA